MITTTTDQNLIPLDGFASPSFSSEVLRLLPASVRATHDEGCYTVHGPHGCVLRTFAYCGQGEGDCWAHEVTRGSRYLRIELPVFPPRITPRQLAEGIVSTLNTLAKMSDFWA